VGDGLSGIAFGWDHGHGTFIGYLLSDLDAAVGLVGNNGKRLLVPIQKGIHHLAVVQLATADFQA